MINDVLSRNFSYPFQWEYAPFNSVFRNSNGSVIQVQKHSTHDWMIYSILWSQLDRDQQDDVMDFLQAMGFNEESFLLRDELVGFHAARNIIGVADGSTVQFQLKETKTSGSTSKQFDRWEIINDIAFPVSVWVNGVPQPGGWTVNYIKSGKLTFAVAPVTGNIEADFYYLRRVRFRGTASGARRAYHVTDFSLAFHEEGPDGQN